MYKFINWITNYNSVITTNNNNEDYINNNDVNSINNNNEDSINNNEDSINNNNEDSISNDEDSIINNEIITSNLSRLSNIKNYLIKIYNGKNKPTNNHSIGNENCNFIT